MVAHQVTVFVQTYHSRQVAVVGAVANPGMFTLSADETIGSIIQRAGGMSRDASQEILFTAAVADSEGQKNDAPHEGAGPAINGHIHNASLDGVDGAVRPVAATVPSPQGNTPPPNAPSAGSGTIPGVQISPYPTELPVMNNLAAGRGPGCLGDPLRPGCPIDIPFGRARRVLGRAWWP